MKYLHTHGAPNEAHRVGSVTQRPACSRHPPKERQVRVWLQAPGSSATIVSAPSSHLNLNLTKNREKNTSTWIPSAGESRSGPDLESGVG